MCKIILKTLLLIIIFNFIMFGQSYSQVVNVSIPDTMGIKDSTIFIPINVDLKNHGVICYNFEIIFNPDIIIPDGEGASNGGTLSENWSNPVVNTDFSGKIIVGGFFNPPDTIQGAGHLVNLIFTVKGDIGDSTELNFSNFIFNNGIPYALKKGGSFKVVEHGPSSVDNNVMDKSKNIKLFPNYPDPFVANTTISYRLKNRQHVTIKILNLLGQEIKTLKNDEQIPGDYLLLWDGKDKFGNDVSTGIYYCVMSTETFISVEKMIFIK